MQAKTIFLLSLLFFKHFLADFVLQTGEIAEKKGKEFKFLFLHSFHQSFLTFAILFAFGFTVSVCFIVFVIEFFLHSILDYLKANGIFYSKAKFPEKGYFVSFGFDQFLHALTYIAIVYFLSL